MSLLERAPLLRRRIVGVGLAGIMLAGFSLAQPPAPVAAPPSLAASGVPAPKASATRGSPVRPIQRQVSHPLWRELTPAQQQSLAPLAGQWDTLNEPQKRKWIAMSSNFPRLSADEQAKLHSRMTEWAGLSAQQRAQARLSFGETKRIPPDDRKAKWEAYQQLTPDEKKKLAAGVPKLPPNTAAALRPVSPDKLATVPRARINPPDARVPRIAAAPHQVDRNTLLPQHAEPSAPAAPATN